VSQLRVTVSFPAGQPVEEQIAVLDELGQAMRARMGPDQRLTRLPELRLPGGGTGPRRVTGEAVALRVFLLEFPDADGCANALRAIGGWYMRHPDLVVSLKADGPGGGVSLKLQAFSTVAFARAAATIGGLMIG